MVERSLRALSVITSLLVVIGFGVWTTGELARASDDRGELIAEHAPVGGLPDQERAGVWQGVHDAAETLREPFAVLTGLRDPWAERLASTFLALLAYGAGLGFLASYCRGLGTHAPPRIGAGPYA